VSYQPNVIIYEDGKVLWIPIAIYKSSCTIDVEYFPFDEQECDMVFGSWTFNAEQVVLAWYENEPKVQFFLNLFMKY
jgi:nicotinic acetylcholine receptor, invertebrate